MGCETKGKGAGIRWLKQHVGYAGNNCLTWPLYIDPSRGYGMVGYNGKVHKAHRLMCELAHGPAPTPKHEAAHSCGKGEKGCVNPRHLSWKTRADNQKDRRIHRTAGRLDGLRAKLTVQQAEQIKAQYGTRLVADIAKDFGVTRSTVRQIYLGKIWRDDSKRMIELTPGRVFEIVSRQRQATRKRLASEYNTSESAIWRIQTGKNKTAMRLLAEFMEQATEPTK